MLMFPGSVPSAACVGLGQLAEAGRGGTSSSARPDPQSPLKGPWFIWYALVLQISRGLYYGPRVWIAGKERSSVTALFGGTEQLL